MEKTVMYQEKHLNPKLLIIGSNSISEHLIGNGKTLGRTTPSVVAGIHIPFNFVSRQHGEFFLHKKTMYYRDTMAKNNTYYNGNKIFTNKSVALSNGDILQIRNSVNPEEIITMIYSTDYTANYVWNVLNLPVNDSELIIGRQSGSHVGLQDKQISAKHASIFKAKKGWAIVDHNSTNGVFLNNQKITVPVYLQNGDCFRIANTYFVYMGCYVFYQQATNTPSSATPAVQKKVPSNTKPKKKLPAGSDLIININERSVWQRAKKLMLLQDINMTIKSGEMALILGGSGAGKTTFMNAVMGYEKADGKILHGKSDIYQDFKSMKYEIGFVPQQDLLRGSDKVYDTLQNSADMKLPSNISKADKQKRIEFVLETLGLKRESQSLVSKLSGGQRKRLSIAVEYISDPSLFFLDEPDSGLDGIMSKALMQNLRNIADEGKIVMVISHAPDRTVELFDKVIVLAKSAVDNCGHLAFFGSPEEAYQFFDVDSLEGVVKRINRVDEGGDGKSDYYINKYKNEGNKR